MEQATIPDLVSKRNYIELEKQAEEYLGFDDWKGFLHQIRRAGNTGKSRDALVSLLELRAVGGTDSDVFVEFEALEGDSLEQIRLEAIERALDILKDQIENRHTYFLDVEAMAETPYAILVKDVIDSRKRELAQLEVKPSRIDVLGTYYGFMILMIDGSKHYEASNTGMQGYGYRYNYRQRRSWLDESITETAVNAMKQLTGDYAEPVEMDKTYRTIGNSSIFKRRCQKTTAAILADAARLALYKVPGNRGAAARALGRTEDERALEFLHHRLAVEQNRSVRTSIVSALGRIGHVSSIDSLMRFIQQPTRRHSSKEAIASVSALGNIDSPQISNTLLRLMKEGKNEIRACAIQVLAQQDIPGLVDSISPYLKHASRPVVRASVTALIGLGHEGEDAIKAAMPTVLARFGNDRGSKIVLTKMLELPEVGQMHTVQDYFALKIKKMTTKMSRWQSYARKNSQSYYYNRWERRTRNELEWWLSQVSKYLFPPFLEELVRCIKSVFSSMSDTERFASILSDSPYAKEVGLPRFQPFIRRPIDSKRDPDYFV
jgi:hypothetical protein